MKQSREYSLKGTQGLEERRDSKRERKREAEIINRDRKTEKKGGGGKTKNKHDRETN